ncbi:conserved hypothetical protein [Theileria equi strain WA]|uniref:Mitochondrial import inner membrane translocase subunit TIM50 n=1 Tax=Theileria equi strain WA TaxID=1537102 RepID=L1LFZ0_THEEQ|nr:conserved hypothetical protein [Theileria equi strain WA]EKX74180.1 conserved hypothetical protein [Theileria equi strain WA]|eukprot:XP_004833632.1 conserved hypothetical protein [Theileria equi strain WA]
MFVVRFKNLHSNADRSLLFRGIQRKYATPQRVAFTSLSRDVSGKIDVSYSNNYFLSLFSLHEREKLKEYQPIPWNHRQDPGSRAFIHTSRSFLDKAQKNNTDNVDSTKYSAKDSEFDAEKAEETSSNLESDKESTNNDASDKPKWIFSPFGIFGCAGLFFTGCGLSYLLDEGRSHSDPSAFYDKDEKLTMQNAFRKIKVAMQDYAVHILNPKNEPLLPDYKDLNYPPNLPTLVIDMDKVVAKIEYDRKNGWRVKKRPYADQFFRELVNYFEIVIWSDDSYPVATDIASRWGLPVIGCIHRNHCKKFKGNYIKDLSRLGRDLKRVILVDHDRVACMLQEKNAILIKEYNGDENDMELYYLINLLKTIAINPQDVTVQIKNLGGGLDYELGRRFSEQLAITQEKAKNRMNISKKFGFKHF